MKNIDFEITYVATEAIGMKLPVVELEGLLNKSLALNNYGDGVQKLFFVFLAVPPEDAFHKPYVSYTEAEYHLEIAFGLPYQEVLDTDPNEIMQLMETAFLNAMKLCMKAKILNFDWRKFYTDVENTFNQKQM